MERSAETDMSRLFETANAHEGPSELPVGMKVEVLQYNGELYFMGKLEWARNGTYQVTSEDGSPLPYIEYNGSVKLRGQYKGEVLFVEGKIVGSSASMWRIEQSKTVRGADQRNFFRQNIKATVTITCANDLRGADCGEKTPQGKFFTATMMNLSAGGTQISTTAEFEKSDWISIVEAELVPEMAPFNFICAIRRKTNADNKGREFIYGCEFLDMGPAEQDRLIKAILTLQRKEIRARRGGHGI